MQGPDPGKLVDGFIFYIRKPYLGPGLKISLFLKILLLVAVLMVAYGYLCRALDLYFFWESKYLGFSLMALGLIFLSFASIRHKKNQKVIPEITAIILSIMFLAGYIYFTVLVYFSDAYEVATHYVTDYPELENETGKVQHVSLIPFGDYQWTWSNGTSSGYAVLNLTVKGEKSHKDVTVFVEKNVDDSGWTVIDLEPYELSYSMPEAILFFNGFF